MAGKKFSAILTGAGEAALAAGALSGVPVGFSVMAVGDGGGSLPEPNPEQTQLVNEVYRAPLNRLIIVEQRANIIRAEMLIPAQAGGFWLREAALYDDAGVCLAVANLPESYKPQLTEGSGRLHSVNLWIAVNNTADVELKSDPSVILATVDEVKAICILGLEFAHSDPGFLVRSNAAFGWIALFSLPHQNLTLVGFSDATLSR